jgi:hypothetical protein
MNQAQQNMVRTLAKQCIEAHAKLDRKLTNAEMKEFLAPYREKAKLASGGECCAIMFTIIMGQINGTLKERG